MFYFFRRGHAWIRCEVRDAPGDGYDLIIDRPDAMMQVEHFRGVDELNRRWAELQRALQREGWWGPQSRSG
ncbi:MAG TPA: hypothetical protein VNI83_15765 [Vicinamibacterales bacterium]|nr:hypothetical protein [Vicinamibacterales bacterium]